MKIAVLDDYQDVFQKFSRIPLLDGYEVTVFRDAAKDPAALAARLKDVDIVILSAQRSPLPRAVIEKLTKLRLIVQTTSLTNHIDIAACTEKGIGIAVIPSGVSHSTAELTWGLIVASLRHIPYEMEQLKKGVWQTTAGTELHGKTLGIYGLGRIGGCVAQVGKAFGMKVICWGREASRAKMREAGYEVPTGREAFFESADVVSLHIYYNSETHGIVTAADLARMKHKALLVNTGRAQLIQEGALVEALKQGRPGYAAVDVYEEEPVLGGNHPLLKMPNVICTPHLGGAVDSVYESRYSAAIDSILEFVSGKPENVINPEALRRQ